MKKIIVLMLCLTCSLYATDYLVDDAGTSAANGVYSETDRIINSKPVYEKGIYRLGYRNCSARWVIVDGDDDENIEGGYCPLYKNENNTSTVPLSGWLVGDEGSSPAPSVSEISGLFYTTDIFTESTDNDGTIENTITISYIEPGSDYFTGSNGVFSTEKYTGSNIPAGLTMVITKNSDTELEAELSGKATNHTNSYDISNLEIVFNDNAFNNSDASAVDNSTKSDLQVNFREAYTVASSGGDYSTIASAISSVDDGDILNLAAETFTEAGLVIDKDLIIIGQDASSTIVQAHASQGSASNRVFTISSGSVIIKNITIRNGKTTSSGGGIYFDGDELEIANSVISNNISDYYGGGINNDSSGTLTIENSTIINNTSIVNWSRGGGIYSESGSLIMSNSTITGNQCIGLYTKGGGVSGKGTITNTTITENSCTDGGGAIQSYGFTLNNCTIKDNSTGVYLYRGTLTICNTIIVDNDSYDYNGESTSLSDNGYNIVENSSKAANVAGGFSNPTSILYNTKYNDSGTSFTNWSQGGSILDNQNLNLSSTLADNGGPTQTLAVSSGSFAIGNGLYDESVTTDQRGVNRAAFPTIGAYEFSSDITFADGSMYNPNPVLGQNDQPIGRFSLFTDVVECELKAVSIKLDENRSGFSNFKFWVSTDDTFGSDTQLGSVVEIDPGIGESIVFSDFDHELSLNTEYYFLTSDVVLSATGEIVAKLTDNSALSFSGGSLTNNIENALLSYSENPLPVTLSSFTGSMENGLPILKWTTQSETENLGWNIYRSEDENGLEDNLIKLNAELIPGMGTISVPTEYFHIDEIPTQQMGMHYYWLESVSYSGELEIHGPVSINLSNSNLLPDTPAKSFVNHNYPNPFNPTTTIEFGIEEGECGTFSIYNVLGQKVLSQKYESGFHTFSWNTSKQASGVYFYQLKTPSYFQTNKMLMLK